MEARAAWLRESFARGKPLHFSTRAPLAHNLLNLSAYALLLAAWVALVALARVLPAWGFLLLAGPGLALVFFALVVLVVHEGSHGMFVIGGDNAARRKWNRFFGWQAALPFGIHYVKHWEEGHIVHHQRPVEEDDPQQYNRDTGPALVRSLLLHVLLPGWAIFHRFLGRTSRRRRHSSRWVALGALTFWTVVGTVSVHLAGWVTLAAYFWAVQLLFGLNQLKGSLEHGGAIAFEPDPWLRSRTSFFPGRRLILPMNISLHFEHHLNMGVPWYLLVRYHRAIAEVVPEPLRPEIFNRGRGIWEQLMGRKGAIPEEKRHLLVEASSDRAPALVETPASAA